MKSSIQDMCTLLDNKASISYSYQKDISEINNALEVIHKDL